MKNRTITIEAYSEQWPLAFRELQAIFNQHLEHLISSIEHVGSTAVPGLAAKPIIDIDIIIKDKSRFEEITAILKTLGYTHEGDRGIPGREAFSGPLQPKHHLYVCLEDSISLKNHLLLRNYLRSHPEKAREYGELKKQLAEKYPDNIDLYVENKTAFITDILKETGLDADKLQDITTQNKALKKQHGSIS
ncbi:GrpB family protein [Chitinophaga sp. SYP-B3965]|uniref:GrpB family protein n=1 Tax=Chitinophaga sp. SYP-B3965 TaxID=2663120 RepID=UPI0012997F70|nr:GrpB family protein [Chitinophaga sp. SYP-B3965]MRG45543.1 GrpB family protein [Chitinophaga sp. SYP-B3965]